MAYKSIDLRFSRRMVTAGCVVLAPTLVGLVRGTYPPFSKSHANAVIASFAHHAGSARVELAALLIAAVVLPFFVLGVYRLTSRRAPVWAAAGAVVGLIGWIMTPFLGASDALAYELARHGGSPAIYDFFNNSAYISAGTAIFLVGHELGTVALGGALWRSRVVPTWAAGAFIAAPILHAASVGAGARGLDIVAFAILTVAAVAVARAIVATPDDEWDLPSETAPAALPSANSV